MRVLVTLGKHPKTLAAVRSIGRSGREVYVVDDKAMGLTSFSRYCAGAIRVPSPAVEPDSFFKELESICSSERIDLLIPMDDPECDVLCKNRTRRLGGAVVAMPDPKAFRVARNKYLTCKLAKELGVPVPTFALIENTAELASIVASIGYPAVAKPVIGSGSRGLRYVTDSSAISVVPEVLARHGAILAQEFIPFGGAIGVSLLMNEGRVRACFAYRRLVQFPESGGPSIIRESVRHPVAESYARLLLESLGWHGVAMVEFRVDARTNTPVLMEINPRFWGSLSLAVKSGVDFPKLLCDMYETGDVPTVNSYSTGVRCANLLPFGVASVLGPGGLRRLMTLLNSVVCDRCLDVESLSDPLPVLGALVTMAELAIDRSTFSAVFRR